MANRKALICGISGQDGAYLTKFLLGKGYDVFGTSRDVEMNSFSNLERLGVRRKVHLTSMIPEDYGNVFRTVKSVSPDEIYYLAGQSSVALSFSQPAETIRGVTLGILNILEACKDLEAGTKVYNAGSSECFGDTRGIPAHEGTRFEPRSSYAVAKASAFWLTANYRDAYGLQACTGILFNHESPLRPERFVTRKIVEGARRISEGSTEKLHLGRLDVIRDWGWAPDYVEAMWLMLQQAQVRDFVIATGESHTLEYFVSLTFSHFGLDWRAHVVTDPDFLRPNELMVSRADPNLAKSAMGWSASHKLPDIVSGMISGEIS